MAISTLEMMHCPQKVQFHISIVSCNQLVHQFAFHLSTVTINVFEDYFDNRWSSGTICPVKITSTQQAANFSKWLLEILSYNLNKRTLSLSDVRQRGWVMKQITHEVFFHFWNDLYFVNCYIFSIFRGKLSYILANQPMIE